MIALSSDAAYPPVFVSIGSILGQSAAEQSQRRRSAGTLKGGRMLVVRFKVRCQPGRTGEVAAAMEAVAMASRELPGVVHFDVARDLTDADALIATEVFDDREAMERQEAQPEVARVVELLQSGAASDGPEWTIYEIASSESPAM
jgi:quinol monooxygenase YgiN